MSCIQREKKVLIVNFDRTLVDELINFPKLLIAGVNGMSGKKFNVFLCNKFSGN